MNNQIKPEVLGQLLLMQTLIGSLPDEERIFDFACKGLVDVPGVQYIEWQDDASVDHDETTVILPIKVENAPARQLLLHLSDRQAFEPYLEYIKNFSFMLTVLLEERNQRRINESHQKNLERRIAERTRDLEKEIAERKKTEAALLQSENLFRASFEYAVIGECLTEPDGKIIMVNSAFAHMLGYEPAALAGRNVIELTHEDDIALSKLHMLGLLDNTVETVAFEKRYVHASGTTVWSSVGTFLFRNVDAAPQFFITHISDISAQKAAETERLELEEQLRHAQKMEAIGTLAGGIAHDFNNILAVIIGYTELAAEDLPPASEPRQSLEQVQLAADRAKELVRQILFFSRKQPRKLMPVDIRGVIAETTKLLRASIPATIDIVTNLDAEAAAIMADRAQIEQILMNLCTNGAQAMEETGGTLTVEQQCLDLDRANPQLDQELPSGRYVVLSVTDTGTGINEDLLGKIFDPYFTTKEVGKGSGMGLSVVIGLVKSHNGIIRVASRKGVGTTFTIYFPCITGGVEKPISPPPSPIEGNEHILVVDDERAIVEILQRSLQSLGYQVTATCSSPQALEIFRKNPTNFDLVITDQSMPRLSGEILCRNLKGIRSDVPIIMCTGYTTRVDAAKAATLGIHRFLLKPVSRIELAVAIRQSLDEAVTEGS